MQGMKVHIQAQPPQPPQSQPQQKVMDTYEAMKLPPSPTHGKRSSDTRRARRQNSRHNSLGKIIVDTQHSRENSCDAGSPSRGVQSTYLGHSRAPSVDSPSIFAPATGASLADLQGHADVRVALQAELDTHIVTALASATAVDSRAAAVAPTAAAVVKIPQPIGHSKGHRRRGSQGIGAAPTSSDGVTALYHAVEPSTVSKQTPAPGQQQQSHHKVPPMSVDDSLSYLKSFEKLAVRGKVQGTNARDFFLRSKLTGAELSAIWKLADVDKDGQLNMEEFAIAMHLVIARKKGVPIPASLPTHLHSPSLANDSGGGGGNASDSSSFDAPPSNQAAEASASVSLFSQQQPLAAADAESKGHNRTTSQTKVIASAFESGLANESSNSESAEQQQPLRSPVLRGEVRGLSQKLGASIPLGRAAVKAPVSEIQPRGRNTSMSGLPQGSGGEDDGEFSSAKTSGSHRKTSSLETPPPPSHRNDIVAANVLVPGDDLLSASFEAESAEDDESDVGHGPGLLGGGGGDEKPSRHRRVPSLLSGFGKIGKTQSHGSEPTKMVISKPTEPRPLVNAHLKSSSPRRGGGRRIIDHATISAPVINATQSHTFGPGDGESGVDVDMNDPERLKQAIHKSAIQMTALEQLCREMQTSLAMARRERMELEIAIQSTSIS